VSTDWLQVMASHKAQFGGALKDKQIHAAPEDHVPHWTEILLSHQIVFDED